MISNKRDFSVIIYASRSQVKVFPLKCKGESVTTWLDKVTNIKSFKISG